MAKDSFALLRANAKITAQNVGLSVMAQCTCLLAVAYRLLLISQQRKPRRGFDTRNRRCAIPNKDVRSAITDIIKFCTVIFEAALSTYSRALACVRIAETWPPSTAESRMMFTHGA